MGFYIALGFSISVAVFFIYDEWQAKKARRKRQKEEAEMSAGAWFKDELDAGIECSREPVSHSKQQKNVTGSLNIGQPSTLGGKHDHFPVVSKMGRASVRTKQTDHST